ncbi:hypothetical protein BZG36_00072 [Bifiguratus adelaidae]|uniref:PH domain-containing protein n=1 Tax=Bifiguratus adelaidae TaxID=1938954 RepID=A0A261Y8Q7_9FUNG|nr:hypothetical protein BZG36_00072 [Bifiguratus adelaidae]
MFSRISGLQNNGGGFKYPNSSAASPFQGIYDLPPHLKADERPDSYSPNTPGNYAPKLSLRDRLRTPDFRHNRSGSIFGSIRSSYKNNRIDIMDRKRFLSDDKPAESSPTDSTAPSTPRMPWMRGVHSVSKMFNLGHPSTSSVYTQELKQSIRLVSSPMTESTIMCDDDEDDLASDLKKLKIDAPVSLEHRPTLTRIVTEPANLSHRLAEDAKAIFFIKVLQVINKASHKDYDIRIELNVNGELRSSGRATSMKSGKHMTGATFDETFTFDVHEPVTCILEALAAPKQKSAKLSKQKTTKSKQPFGGSTNNLLMKSATLSKLSLKLDDASANSMPPLPQGTNELSFGECEFVFPALENIDKSVKRVPLTIMEPAVDSHGKIIHSKIDAEVVVMVGMQLRDNGLTHRSSRSLYGVGYQDHLHEDFLTLYVRGSRMPSWKRFWAVVDDVNLFLYDFEYKENKEPVATLPLTQLLHVSHPSQDESARIDIGRFGLTLHFNTRYAIASPTPVYMDEADEFEGKMYVLSDGKEKSKRWEEVFLGVVARRLEAEAGWAARRRRVREDMLDRSEGVDVRYLW